MNSSTDDEFFDNENYQRPNQPWVCGWHSAGTPCPLGPHHNGDCQVEQTCNPQRDGDKWVCTSHKLFGLTKRECAGPIPDPDNPGEKATCPNTPPPCQPQRSIRKLRGLLTGLVVAASFGACLILAGGRTTQSAISPGHVASPHAPFEQNCAACHAAGETSAIDQVSCVFGGSTGLDQSQRCLKCHELGQNPLHAHSMEPGMLSELTNQSKTDDLTLFQTMARMGPGHETTSSGEIACATCHQEHKGRMHDLTRLTNQQCQSCHTSTFHSFDNGHPEFVDKRRTNLYFDHSTHIGTHFANFDRTAPDGKAPTSCTTCHTSDSNGHPMGLRSFEDTCARCHDHQIEDLHMPALQLAVRKPKLQQPFADLVSENLQQDSGSLLANLELRPRNVLNRGLPGLGEKQINGLMEYGLADSMIKYLQQPAPSEDSEPSDDEATASVQPGFEITPTSLNYRARGHADPFLRTLLDAAASQVTSYTGDAGSSAPPAERLLAQLGNRASTGQCLKCHTLDSSGDKLRINWEPRQPKLTLADFVDLARPHPHLSGDGFKLDPKVLFDSRCESCHAVQRETLDFLRKEFVQSDGMPNPNSDCPASSSLNRITTASCVNCHTKDLAGDNCLQCHDYHIHGSKLVPANK